MRMAHLAALLAMAGILAAGAATECLLESNASSLAGIADQTGAELPSDVQVLDTDVSWLTIADGTNYDWLLSGTSSLVPWAELNGQREGPGITEGWSHIESFSEIASFDYAPLDRLGLHSVWRIVKHTADGGKETAYLYIASDETTAILGTFRP